jgi:hypothetical protein
MKSRMIWSPRIVPKYASRNCWQKMPGKPCLPCTSVECASRKAASVSRAILSAPSWPSDASTEYSTTRWDVKRRRPDRLIRAPNTSPDSLTSGWAVEGVGRVSACILGSDRCDRRRRLMWNTMQVLCQLYPSRLSLRALS